MSTSKSVSDQLASIKNIMEKPEIPFYRFNFGKHEGKTLEYVVKNDKTYLNWLYSNVEELPKKLELYIQCEVLVWIGKRKQK